MIVSLDWQHAIHVSCNMRTSDFNEVMANRWNNNPHDFAAECMRLQGLKLACVGGDGIPVAIGGVTSHVPGVGQAWLVGTRDIGKYGLEIAHVCKEWTKRLFDDGTVHRIQAFSAATHTKAHQWLIGVGLKQEGTLKYYGKNKEDFLIFSIVKEN